MSELRDAAVDVLSNYDAYCEFWDDKGEYIHHKIEDTLGVDLSTGFEQRQVSWVALDRLRDAVNGAVGE
jgi:hypothetical protein